VELILQEFKQLTLSVSTTQTPTYPPLVQEELLMVEQELEIRYLKSILVPALQEMPESLSVMGEYTEPGIHPALTHSEHFTSLNWRTSSLRTGLERVKHYEPITTEGKQLLHTSKLMLDVRETLERRDWQG